MGQMLLTQPLVPWSCLACPCPHHQATTVNICPGGSLGAGRVRVQCAHPMMCHCKEWWCSSFPGLAVTQCFQQVTQWPSSTPNSGTVCVPMQRWQFLGVACPWVGWAACPIARGDAWLDFTPPGPDFLSPPAGERGNPLVWWAARVMGQDPWCLQRSELAQYFCTQGSVILNNKQKIT